MSGQDRRDFIKAAGALAVGGTAMTAGCTDFLDDEYPSSDIRHIIPWDAGGGTDAVGRGFVDFAEEYLDTEIFTENIAGAVSGQGISTVMDAEPDGYTIGTMTWDSYVTVEFFELIDDYSIDRLRILNTYTEQPCVFCVHEDSDIESMDDWIAYAEENPGELDVSTAGESGITHMPSVNLEIEAGIEHNYVHFEGGGGQSEALGTGEVEAGSPTLGLLDPVMDSVRILAVCLPDRFEMLEDTPTIVEETGMELFWNSTRHICVPEDVDEDIIDTLKEAFENVAEDDDWQEWIFDTEGSWTWYDEDETMDLIENTQQTTFELYDELGIEP